MGDVGQNKELIRRLVEEKERNRISKKPQIWDRLLSSVKEKSDKKAT